MAELSDKQLKDICKMGQGGICCRYIVVDPDIGIICGKLIPSHKLALDSRVDRMVAKGDNCEGIE